MPHIRNNENAIKFLFGNIAKKRATNERKDKSEPEELRRWIAPGGVGCSCCAAARGRDSDRLPWFLGEGAGDESNQYQFPGRKPDPGEVYLQRSGNLSATGLVRAPGGNGELCADRHRSGRAPRDLRALGALRPPRRNAGASRGAAAPACRRLPPGPQPLRRPRLWRPLPSARFAAPLCLYALCAGCKAESARGSN